MPDATTPTYAELMDRANRAEEKIVRLISEAERTEERLANERDEALARIAELETQQDRVTDLFETWAAEENEHRLANEFGIAEGLKVAIDGLREAVHGSEGQANG